MVDNDYVYERMRRILIKCIKRLDKLNQRVIFSKPDMAGYDKELQDVIEHMEGFTGSVRKRHEDKLKTE